MADVAFGRADTGTHRPEEDLRGGADGAEALDDGPEGWLTGFRIRLDGLREAFHDLLLVPLAGRLLPGRYPPPRPATPLGAPKRCAGPGEERVAGGPILYQLYGLPMEEFYTAQRVPIFERPLFQQRVVAISSARETYQPPSPSQIILRLIQYVAPDRV